MARPAPRQRITFQDDRLLDPAVQPMLLDRIKRMHGSGFQQDVQFGNVYNKQTGQYDFSKYDALVNAARQRGLKNITFRLYGTPAYKAKTRPGIAMDLSSNNPNAALAGKFAEQVAMHFAGRVDRYGVWNEPNVSSFLRGDPRQAAKEYGLIYDKMRQAIKGVRPAAQVGFGEITSQAPNTPGYGSTIGFLKAVLQQRKRPIRADYMAIHPYQWSDPSKKVGNAWYGGISNLPAIQQELARQAAAGKLVTSGGHRVPLAVSEYGYKHDIANRAQRAAWLKRSMDMFRKAGVRDVNLYQLLPSAPGAYWDSSVLGPHGEIPSGFANILRRRRGR